MKAKLKRDQSMRDFRESMSRGDFYEDFSVDRIVSKFGGK